MAVTLARLHALTWSVRTLVAALFLVAVLVMSKNVAFMRGRVESFRPQTSFPIYTDDMSTVTFSKVANGVTYTRTYTRNEGETEEAFDVRAKALWEAFCKLHGI